MGRIHAGWPHRKLSPDTLAAHSLAKAWQTIWSLTWGENAFPPVSWSLSGTVSFLPSCSANTSSGAKKNWGGVGSPGSCFAKLLSQGRWSVRRCLHLCSFPGPVFFSHTSCEWVTVEMTFLSSQPSLWLFCVVLQSGLSHQLLWFDLQNMYDPTSNIAKEELWKLAMVLREFGCDFCHSMQRALPRSQEHCPCLLFATETAVRSWRWCQL